MKKLIIALLALGVVLAISACNTIRGAGEDVQSVGRGIDRAANAR